MRNASASGWTEEPRNAEPSRVRKLSRTPPTGCGVYDRHDYSGEKADALVKLAALIERIINPPAADNVVVLREAAVQS
jgi:hypothetical protein